MDLKDFTDLGNDIGRRVSDAVNHMEFDQLNRDIRRKIDQAFNGTDPGRTYPGNGGFGGLNGKLYHGDETGSDSRPDFTLYKEGRRQEDLQVMVPVAPKIPGRVSGILMMVFGYSAAVIFGIAAIACGILGITMSSVGVIPAGVMGAVSGGLSPLFLAGLIVGIIGTKQHGRASRFRRYLQVLKGRTFCALKEMAAATGKSIKYVAKDLQKMIEKGFFQEGHLDQQRTCFIGTNEMYSQYLQAKESAAQSAREQQMQQKTESEDYAQNSGDSIDQVISEGEAYLKTIREANDAIYNPEISEKLYRMEVTVEKIFDYVEKNPDQVTQLRRFMSYYMPTTEKLVNAYRELDQQTIQGKNISKAKKEIAQTLDTINEAYEKLYDSMYADVAMDVSSDIAVLKTLFAQEGLAKDAMNGGKKRE